jgi:uncharacterized membrane protein
MLTPSSRLARLDLLLAAASLILIVVLLILAPHGLLDKADRAAYAVCHRIADRSFIIAGRQLPLCARCSGLYLGAGAALLTLAALGRSRAGRFPARPYLFILALFMAIWAADGLNSFLALLGLPHLYEPSNRLRLITGTLAGVALASVLLPALSITLWRRPADRRSIERPSDLLWLLCAGAVVVLVILAAPDWMLYPLAILSGLMVPFLLGLLNAMFYLSFTRREGRAERWQQVLAPLIVGLVAACVEIALIGLARDALTARFGMPF